MITLRKVMFISSLYDLVGLLWLFLGAVNFFSSRRDRQIEGLLMFVIAYMIRIYTVLAY